MNFYIVSLLEAMAEQNIATFCKLNFVKSAIFFSDFQQLSIRLKSVGDFYYRFLKQVKLLPLAADMVDYIGNYDLTSNEENSLTVLQAIKNLNQQGFIDSIIPVHLRYTDQSSMHIVTGIAVIENKKNGFLHLIDLCIPKNLLKNIPYSISYVRDILESYNPDEKQSIKDFVGLKGYCYNQFSRDCRIYFGDTFYSFLLKLKMIKALADIIFTGLSLKEIAFRNQFIDYANMYKTFSRNGFNLMEIPRLANL